MSSADMLISRGLLDIFSKLDCLGTNLYTGLATHSYLLKWVSKGVASAVVYFVDTSAFCCYFLETLKF